MMTRLTWTLFLTLGLLGMMLFVNGCGTGLEPAETAATDSGTTSPNDGSVTTDPGTTDPGTTDPGTTDPAGALTLLWDAPTTNEDGTALANLAGYKVYYGTAAGNYSTSTDVSNTTSISLATLNLQGGQTYYFAVTSYDAAGNESDYSNEVSKLLL